MKDTGSWEYEAMELKAYVMDTIDTYECDEVAQMIREGILTIEEVESGLRRRIG